MSERSVALVDDPRVLSDSSCADLSERPDDHADDLDADPAVPLDVLDDESADDDVN